MVQRAFGLDIPQTLEDICDPKRLALIITTTCKSAS